MSIGFGQILVLVLIAVLLFGNLPKVIKDLGKGTSEAIKEIKSTYNKVSEESGKEDSVSEKDKKETKNSKE